jgi:uncharacterized protein YhbP (UPF0306 family)
MSKMHDQLERIAKLLREQTTLSLATSDENGLPSAAPLFYIADEELTLYWLSSQSSQHSRNLQRRPCAAATVYCPAMGWKEIRGVQMRGAVSIVTEPERRSAHVKAYCERFKLGRVFRLAIRRSILFALQPEFFRSIDNTKAFGDNYELTRPSAGWSLPLPSA